ncbi:uncharacterized protein RSE6_10472 [Rhynchosporium secalis]|uniref:Uncharacterized protein n=1 Tax=Rhynchosporium secalis TaxID=38038 RepID=A0A1E1MKJ1_RHYSE|nr:uncharacterized protein RSE6_10472 [Rhynchosporium secalis]
MLQTINSTFGLRFVYEHRFQSICFSRLCHVRKLNILDLMHPSVDYALYYRIFYPAKYAPMLILGIFEYHAYPLLKEYSDDSIFKIALCAQMKCLHTRVIILRELQLDSNLVVESLKASTLVLKARSRERRSAEITKRIAFMVKSICEECLSQKQAMDFFRQGFWLDVEEESEKRGQKMGEDMIDKMLFEDLLIMCDKLKWVEGVWKRPEELEFQKATMSPWRRWGISQKSLLQDIKDERLEVYGRNFHHQATT